MNIEEKHKKQFEVVLFWVSNNLSEQRVFLDKEEFFRAIRHPALSDAQCLFRLIIKEVEHHNSKLQTKKALLNNLKYSSRYLSSKVFSGLNIPTRQIDELITKFPDKRAYDIYRMVMGWETHT
jgi:hypothetical protein